MKIAVGTSSKLKIRALNVALNKLEISWEAISVETSSGVSDQPFGFEEIISGARNRASAALRLADSADYGIGIENGIIKVEEIGQWFDTPCICIVGKNSEESFSFGSFFFVPQWVIDKIKEKNSEFGYVIQEIDASSEKDPIRYFSADHLKREEILTQAIECALLELVFKEKYLRPQ